MIYLIYGNSHQKAREKVRALVDAQIVKKPDALSFRITTENWKDTNLAELIQSQGLFVSKYIVVFDHLLREEGSNDTLLEALQELAESPHIFIFLEDELTKEILKKVEKKAEKVQEISEAKKPEAKGFNVFLLTDAFGMRNKKDLWVLYEKAIVSGVEPEEIHGILFWQTKAMLASVQANSPEEAGLKPFVYQKSSRFAKNFKIEELRELSSRLVSIPHDSRRGLIDFGTALERFILGV